MNPVIIGDATLYLGDCMDVLPLFNAVEALVSDPPYGIAKKMCGGGMTTRSIETRRQIKRMMEWDLEPPNNLVTAWVNASDNAIIWGGNYFDLPASRKFLVWAKGSTMYGRTFAECEQAWCSFDGTPRILEIPPDTHMGTIAQHPTQKPVRLMNWTIQQLPAAASVVTDPFMGSGTTGIAAMQLGRKFIGIERDEEYFEIACKRIEQAVAQGQLFAPEQPTQEQKEIL